MRAKTTVAVRLPNPAYPEARRAAYNRRPRSLLYEPREIDLAAGEIVEGKLAERLVAEGTAVALDGGAPELDSEDTVDGSDD